MKTFLLPLIIAVFLLPFARGHDEPTSFVDLKLGRAGIDASFTASTTDLAHYLPDTEPGMLLDGVPTDSRRAVLSALIASQFKVTADGSPVVLTLGEITPIPEKRDVRLTFHADLPAVPKKLRVESALFPYDPRHRTYVNVYSGDELLRQEAFEKGSPAIDFDLASTQGLMEVIGEFVYEGIHHIFIGPDHILFVVGLMLLGGGVKELLKIVTAFTVAHSITLCLATFRILSPPADVIEPVIALSIVFVGAHALLGAGSRDPRLIFAFVFGLIHGFGFANVLQEMTLPPQALGWSLFAFNAGVEIGQACIVLAVAPALAYLTRRSPSAAGRVVAAGALCVTTAGAFWFFQRVMG